MTNLRAGTSGSGLTRERVLVGMPILISGLVLLGLGGFVVAPALVRIDELQTEVVDLQAKQQQLPDLRKQLRQAQQAQQTLLDQQSMLVELIAGQDRIATFLALLEQEAKATGVTIERYEPIAPPAPPSAAAEPARRRTAGSRQSQADAAEPPADPMVALGYRQTAVRLGATGDYRALQSFLQRMEALEMVVEASDLELTSATEDVASGRSPTELALRLSFFDRRPDSGDDTAAVKPD